MFGILAADEYLNRYFASLERFQVLSYIAAKRTLAVYPPGFTLSTTFLCSRNYVKSFGCEDKERRGKLIA